MLRLIVLEEIQWGDADWTLWNLLVNTTLKFMDP